MEKLIKVLELSVQKNGAETPITLGHLLNIMKMVHSLEAFEEGRKWQEEVDAFNSSHGDILSYGNN